MNFTELYKTLLKYKYTVFCFDDLLKFFPSEKKNNLKVYIHRWKEKGMLTSLKRGLYELIYPKDSGIPDMYIANVLYSPSYVSLETALSNYSIIPEVSMAVTSITTKATRKFKNKHGLFIYHTVNPRAFNGYYIEKHGSFDIFIAEPEKALVDYFYFNKPFKKNNLKDERMDTRAVMKLSRKKITRYAAQYKMDLRGLYADT